MAETVKLSEMSKQASMALAAFDADALDGLMARLEAAAAGGARVEPEPVEAIRAKQRVLAEVLIATEQNIHVLRRLRERKARNEWDR